MPQLEMSFFNGLEVTVHGQSISNFRSARVAGLLVYLALEGDVPRQRDHLAALFWPEEPQTTARKNLRQSLYQLRKTLGETHEQGAPFLLVTRQTAQFNSGSDYRLDVDLFQNAIDRQDLELAETFYSGPLLPAFSCDSRSFDAWLDRKREALQQTALEALHALTERQLALGKPAVSRALVLARRQLDLAPWREQAHRQLMTALAIAGDRSGAIAQFDVCADVLAEELGVSPAPETFALFSAIRDGTFPSSQGAPAPAVPNNIPHPATPCVGRAAEIARLSSHLQAPDSRLITIVGPGGIGKTRLALEAARRLLDAAAAPRFPDGVFLVELAAAATRADLLAACAAALGFALERDVPPLQQLRDFLAGRRLLLILDNVEQLLPAPTRAAGLLATLLRETPGLELLVTSRQKLNLSSESVLPLNGLAHDDDAMQLFARSARRVQPAFALHDENGPAVAEICRLVGGMPLGILLTAAWSHLLSPAAIAAEIRADVDFVAAEMPDLPPRQRSMRAVFDYSWALLSPAEQLLLARLSLFQGGFTRQAAAAVAGAALNTLLGLVNKSLLQRDVNRDRFDLHELLRQLAAEKLAAAGDVAPLRTAHSRHYLGLFETYRSVIQGQWQREALRALVADDQNIQAAWLWATADGDTDQLLPILDAFHFYYAHTGRDFEIARLYEEALIRLPAGDPTFADTADDTTLLRAAILNRLQERGFTAGEDGPQVDIDRLHAYFQARGAGLEEAIVCQHLGFRALAQGNLEQALLHLRRQAVLYEEAGATFRLIHGLVNMATMALRAGEVDRALALAHRCLALAEEHNDRLNTPGALLVLAVHTLGERLDYARAAEQFALITRLGLDLWSDGLTAAIASLGLALQGYVALLQGDMTTTRDFARRQQELVAMRNNSRDRADARLFQAVLDATEGTYRPFPANLLAAASVGFQLFVGLSERLSACGLGDLERARESLLREWSTPLAMRWPAIILRDLPVAAHIVAERHGDLTRAAALLALGRAHPACPLGWWEQLALVRALEEKLAQALPPDEHARAVARGRTLVLSETVAVLRQALAAA